MLNIGIRIKELRQERNMTQSQLAELISIRQESVNRIENEKYNPSYKVLNDICSALGISLSEFFNTESNALPQDLNQLIETAKQLSKEERIKLNDFLREIKKP